MIIKNKKRKGFSLIEISLVLGVAAFIGFIAFTQILKQQEIKKSSLAGDQIKLIGDSVNAYISNHYDKLSTLTNSSGTSLDLGPRTCLSSNNTCTITTTTLINEGLLPSTYSGKNVYGHGYSIILKRSGTSPYYHIYGMITTTESLIMAGKTRYDLLGNAMQSAGIDSGMTKNSSSLVSGFNGAWTASVTDYSNINKQGLLAYQAGYGTYNYSVFLRRDGTLPMTGNLNMGTNSINNAVDYNGTGNINTGGKIVAGNEITAKNGYGDSITLGGDAVSNDYELRLGSGKQLSIYSPNSTQYSTVLSVNRNTIIGERLSTNGLNPNDIPSGWGGGIRTADLYASGTIATGTNRTIKAYMNSSGQMYASSNITSDSMIMGAYLKASTIVSNGNSCTENGAIARDSIGRILSCVSSRWALVDSSPTGSIIVWGSSTIPTGWLECNGQAFNTNSYPALAQLYPSGRVPDFRGYFLRGLDRGVGRDPDSRSLLSVQQDALQQHSHIAGTETSYSDNVPTTSTRNTPGGAEFRQYNNRTGAVNSNWNSARVANETRPKNVAVLYLIKAN